MHIVAFVIGATIGAAIGFGIALALVYGLMWLLSGLLELPYATASSVSFVIFSIGAVIWAATVFFASENKLLGLLVAIYALIATPVMYAAAFNAHRIWTRAVVSPGERYLPGEAWSAIEQTSGIVTDKLASLVPALRIVFDTVNGSPLLTGIVCSFLTAVVFQPMVARR